MIKKNKKLTLCAILCALSLAIMYAGSIIDVLDITTAVIASFSVYIVVIEIGELYPWAVWIITSVLSLILLPTKFGALCYACICGVYPIFKLFFERCHIVISWVLKLSMFNTALIVIMLISKNLLVGASDLPNMDWLYFALGNITFILYDIAMTKILILYTVKWRSRMKIGRYLRK